MLCVIMMMFPILATAEITQLATGDECELVIPTQQETTDGRQVILLGDTAGNSGPDGKVNVGDVTRVLRETVDLETPLCILGTPTKTPVLGETIRVNVFATVNIPRVIRVRLWVIGTPRCDFLPLPTTSEMLQQNGRFTSPPIEMLSWRVHPWTGERAYEVRMIEVEYPEPTTLDAIGYLFSYDTAYTGGSGDLYDAGDLRVFYVEMVVSDLSGEEVLVRGHRENYLGFDPDDLFGVQISYPDPTLP